MRYDPITQKLSVPVFFPETLLKMDIPLEIMQAAISRFNEEIKNKPLNLQTDIRVHARVESLVQKEMDLELIVQCYTDKWYYLDSCIAELIGHVILNKETGAINDLVIEGFRFIKRNDLTFS